MNSECEKFLRNELLTWSIFGALGRSGTYLNASEQNRKDFRNTLRRELDMIAGDYKKSITETQHLLNIEKLAKYLTSQYATILKKGQFRIGIAQKALNLYLKYLWCLGVITEPPHCPFDATILKRLPQYAGLTWTSIDTIAVYKNIVAAAKAKAGSDSLSVWELREWNENQ